MNYYELRSQIKNFVPRRTQLEAGVFGKGAIREKGRKSNYHQFNIEHRHWLKHERLLNTEEINSFAEVSLRASACPMPLNIDVWDGLRCGFGCRYCYADNFRASLYTSFFDNSKSVGLRHCNPIYYAKELDVLLKNWGAAPKGNEVQRAISMGIPLRFGIRFEDFLPIEGKKEISLYLLKYLAEAGYPVMINTKSALVGRGDYVQALANNSGGAAVHMTLISSDDKILKDLEPAAPTYKERLKTMKMLSDAGVRVVARIEPYMVFINDDEAMVQGYIEDVWATGCRHITFDTYSYSANNPGIRRNFYDFERMFLLTTDSQPIGSLLLSKFMKLFRAKGFSCSTFDLGNVPENDDPICCEVGNAFENAGFNWGCAIGAILYIKQQSYIVGKLNIGNTIDDKIRFTEADGMVRWKDFENYVNKMGGFLSDKLREAVHRLWNGEGNNAFRIDWAKGMEAVGYDDGGIIWRWNPETDFRENIVEGLL